METTTSVRTKIDPDVAAIVVVDVQNDFCSPEGKLAQGGGDVSACPQMADNLQSLLTGARSLGVPVVWIQTWRDETTNSDAWLARHGIELEPQGERPVGNCEKGTWGAEFFVVHPEGDEPISRKIRYNAFTGTDLETLLRVIGRPSLLFTGVATNMCVESTLREALFREFHVTLVHDCCAATSPEAQQATIDNVRAGFGPVVSSQEILAAWGVPAAEPSLSGAAISG